MMGIIKPCEEHLSFDDRKLMWIGIPALSIIMPILLDLYSDVDTLEYWTHYVPESFLFVAGFWLFFRWVIISLRRRYPQFKDTKQRLWVQIAVIILSAPILKTIFAYIIFLILRFCSIQDHTEPSQVKALLSIYLPSALIIALYEAMYFFSQYKESLIEKEGLKRIHVQTELDNLRNQINPHFLFNSLNTLMNLIPSDPDSAMNYLTKLSKFYRYIVGAKDEKIISIQKEIEFGKLYAGLLHERFKDALSIDFVETNGISASILPMSLQLLIENAVKHNVVSKDMPLNIQVELDAKEKYLTVKNNLQKKIVSVSSTGMGLDNIRKRFAYFTEQDVRISEDQDHFSVSLPLLNSSR